MRRIVWSEYISLDDVVAEPGEWSIPYFGALAKTPIEHDLVHEIRMLVHPIAVGAGKRLFEGANAPVVLKLVDTPSFDSGVVALTYHAAD